MASGTGLLDINACDWDVETLHVLGLGPDQLSPLGDVSNAFVGLSERYAARWPALRDQPWTPPVGDGACSNLGSGCTTPERIAVMVGTSGAMRVVSETDRIDIPWGLWCYRADRRRVVLGGALNDGGNLADWCRRTFQLGPPEQVEREIAAMEPDAPRPHLSPVPGGRAQPGLGGPRPGVDRGAEPRHEAGADPARGDGGGRAPVRADPRPDLLLLPQAREIVASGGALRESPAWTQILADAMGRPILPSAEPEASSRGAALLALEALGRIPRLEDLPASFGPAVPSIPAPRAYGAALSRQQEHYAKLVSPDA
jgi:gluconokinase